MTIEQLTSFFAWCTLLNMAALLIASVWVMLLRDWGVRMHSNWFGVAEAELPSIYFKYIAYYKILIFVFNLAPYLALRIIA